MDRFFVNQVALTTTNSAGRVLYVVEVPQSVVQAPHQASDRRYYKRYNFQSVPMEDYEIRDVLHRSTAPVLTPTLKRIAHPNDGGGAIRVLVEMHNRGSVIAKYPAFVCRLLGGPYNITWGVLRVGGVQSVYSETAMVRLYGGGDIVVYPGLPLELGSFDLNRDPALPLPESVEIEVSVFAESMVAYSKRMSIPVGTRLAFQFPEEIDG